MSEEMLPPENKDGRSKGGLSKTINITLTVLIVVLVALIIVFAVWLKPMKVTGNSMQHTLESGDIIVLAKRSFNVQRGDIIVFNRPGAEYPPVKRVVGLSGDVVRFDIEAGKWSVNNGFLEEDYVYSDVYDPSYWLGIPAELSALTGDGVTVGEGELFVLGDHRSISYDSHLYGCIQEDWIIGKLLFKF